MSHGQKLAEGTNVTSWAKRRIQFYITREQNIALLITSFQFLSLPLADASQWRQSKQRHHCPVPTAKTTVAQVRGGTWTLRMWVGGCWGCWWLGPMGYWTENLQCHIPIPSPFCWRFTTPGRTMSRRAAPCRGWEGGEMTCCSPWNRLNPLVSHLPSYRTRQRCHTSSKTKTEQINVNCWQRRNIKPEILKILFEILR